MRANDAKCGPRFLAFLIDTLIISTIGTVILHFLPAYTKYLTLYQEAYTDIYEVIFSFNAVDPQAFVNLLKYFLITQGITYAVMVPLFFLYLVVLPHFWSCQTIGRLAAGVKVVLLKDEQKVSFGRLCLRELVGTFLFYEILSNFIVLIITCYLSASKGRSIVDYIGGTRLINLRMPKKEEPIYEGESQEPFEKKDYIDAEFQDTSKFEKDPFNANQLNDGQQDSNHNDDQNSDTEEEYKVV